jgi:hypothetical protein
MGQVGENCITMIYPRRHGLNASMVGVKLYLVTPPISTSSTLHPETLSSVVYIVGPETALW